MTESWRPVPGHPSYEVSDQGRVRNAATLHVLRPHRAGKSGNYLRVHLGRGGRNRMVHRLVAEAFIGPAPTYEPHDVDHLDGDPANNAVTNLRWLSKSLNSGRHPVFARRVGARVEWRIPAEEPMPDGYEMLADREQVEAELVAAGWLQ